MQRQQASPAEGAQNVTVEEAARNIRNREMGTSREIFTSAFWSFVQSVGKSVQLKS